MVAKPSSRIESTPGTCGGRPRIGGSRIRVQDVVVWHEVQGLSPDEIVSAHPTVNLAGVHAALSYYHEHRRRIDADIRSERAFIERMRSEFARLSVG